jgi:mono/diheme cytochrome c family protein
MRMTWKLQAQAFSLMLLVLPMTAFSEDRGRMLYQNHCVACHESTVHIREARKVKSYADLEKYTRRFAGLAGVEWSDADMVLVIEYLNRTRYKLQQ